MEHALDRLPLGGVRLGSGTALHVSDHRGPGVEVPHIVQTASRCLRFPFVVIPEVFCSRVVTSSLFCLYQSGKSGYVVDFQVLGRKAPFL